MLTKTLLHDSQQPWPLLKEKAASLVYADPPFNIGVDYDQHDDKMLEADYREFAEKWVDQAFLHLKVSGWLVICCAPELVYLYQDIAYKRGFIYHDTVAWYRTFGNQSQSNKRLSRGWTAVLLFNLSRETTPNWDHIRVPSDRMIKYQDKRASPKGKIPQNVWQISQVCGTFKEREGWHKCQQPMKLVYRLVVSLTKPKNLVIDPFSGSATTLAVCELVGRRGVGLEISENYVKRGNIRVQTIQQFTVPEKRRTLSRLREGLIQHECPRCGWR